ncbi:hypothetical protein HN011_009727 [Eciton burchellii]|nr:hypothetical protein HN011_009727 [Eciton burchellii]
MGVMKMVRCFKTTTRSDRNVKSGSPISSQIGINEYYRNLLQQFANHCQTSNRDVTDPDWLIYQRNEQNAELSSKNYNQEKSKNSQIIPGIPHVQFSEILEIGFVPGAEKRYLELISAEWRNTKVSLKRYAFKRCQDAIRADMEILSEIRHPNILLLMATTHTDEHGLVSIFEPVDCTLYNYLHVQGERINIQGIIQIGIKLADALKYCHMRGYVHGAISSHCIYFAPDATVKLGGWELARETENVYAERYYAKYLRMEIEKWQAPEMSYRVYATKKSDVYCLALLLWEMCTGYVPYNGNNQSDVQIECIIPNHIVSLRNVPSLLRNLLEIGLQPDEKKRTLDMDKIGRELHRLLVIHEYEKNTTNECETNNNDSLYDISNIKTSSPVHKSPIKIKANERTFAEQQSQIAVVTKSEESTRKKFFTPEKKQCTVDSKNGIKKATTLAIGNHVANSMTTTETSSACTNCAEILNIVQDIDERSSARTNIKRLKQLLASRRERFFSGIDSSSFSEMNSRNNKSSLKKSNSFDYITCKPASHATAIEPRFNKSLTDYDGNTLKSSCTLQRKPPYMSMPASIKDAIMQRQVLHTDTKSFYESILWRKEKEICLSRMGHNNKGCEKVSSLQRSANYNLSTIGEDKTQYHESNTTYINDSYTNIEDNDIENSISRNITSARLPTANKSIQDLKNALERATEIVRSITPTMINDDEYSEKRKCEHVFEDLYNSREIPVVEKSTSDNKSFPYTNGYTSTENTLHTETAEYKKHFNQTSVNDKKLNSLTITIMKTSKGSQKPKQDNAINGRPTDSQQMGQDRTILASDITPTRQQTETDLELNEQRYVNVPVILDNMQKIKSQKRFSLPSRLNPAKTDCPIKAARKNRSDPQSTRYMTEDLYIDDELEGSNLNYNLVLLGDNYEYLLDSVSHDDLRLLQTTEL